MSIQHGTESKYTNDGCRCAECKEVARAAIQRRRRERFALRELVDGRLVAPRPAELHGTVNTYNDWGCRCAPCTRAAEEGRQLRAQREPS